MAVRPANDVADKVPEPDIGARLREERTRRGLSLRKLASILGLSPSALSQIETGRSRPSVSTLYAIVNELEISFDELFPNGSGAKAQRRPPVSRETGGIVLRSLRNGPGDIVQR